MKYYNGKSIFFNDSQAHIHFEAIIFNLQISDLKVNEEMMNKRNIIVDLRTIIVCAILKNVCDTSHNSCEAQKKVVCARKIQGSPGGYIITDLMYILYEICVTFNIIINVIICLICI